MNPGESLLSGKLGERLPDGSFVVIFNDGKGQGLLPRDIVAGPYPGAKSDCQFSGVADQDGKIRRLRSLNMRP